MALLAAPTTTGASPEALIGTAASAGASPVAARASTETLAVVAPAATAEMAVAAAFAVLIVWVLKRTPAEPAETR